MVMTTVDDQALENFALMWENESWGVSNSDNSGKNIGKLEMVKTMDQKEGNEGEGLVNKKRKGTVSRSDKTVANGEEGKSEHEMHIWTERERRKKMRNMFSSLQALLPNVSTKADKSTIVDEAVSYIQKLQQTLEKLEKQKQDRLQCVSPLGCESSVTSSQWQPYDSREAFAVDHHQGSSSSNLSNVVELSKPPLVFQTFTSPNLVLNICGDIAQFCIFSTKKPGLMTTIAFVLEKHRIDVISANILRKGDGNIYMIQAHANRASYFQGTNSVGETYIQAAGEILLWINVA